MSEVHFSVIVRSPEELTPIAASLRHFTHQTRIRVRLQNFTWDAARQELNQIAIHKHVADVSQIGSTWLRGLVDMNAVRPFAPAELRAWGDLGDFVPAAWQSACLDEMHTVWALPWLVDARILFYRRDWLKSAGIDERTAFVTPQALDDTLRALRAHGIAIPWVLPTQFSWRTLHAAASWVWGNGGDFVSADGKQFLFAEAPARQGLCTYFALAQHLVPEARGLSDAESDALFMQGQAAATISGPWIMSMDKDLLSQVGVTSPPGPAFIGGSHLVLWKHAAHVPAALHLLGYLISLEGQRAHGLYGLLPARLEALSSVDIPAREFSRYLQRVLTQGRAFHAPYMWALVEEQLSRTLAQVWTEVLALPTLTSTALDEILGTRLEILARRLKMMFI